MHWLINWGQRHLYLNYTCTKFDYKLKRVCFNYYSNSSKNGNSSGIKKYQDFPKIPKTQNEAREKSTSEENKKHEEKLLEAPEEPTTCCMSGCANCVWLEYAEKLTEYYRDGGEKSVKEINEKITDPNIKAYLLHEIRMRNKR